MLLYLPMQTASQSPVKGNVGGAVSSACRMACQDIRKALLDALSWQTEIWKISIFVKNDANSRRLSGYVYFVRTRRVSVGYGRISYSAWGSASLLVQRRWAFQSLRLWDEQTVRLSRFFFINQSNANEVGPEAPKTNYEQSLFQALGWQRLWHGRNVRQEDSRLGRGSSLQRMWGLWPCRKCRGVRGLHVDRLH